MIYNINLLMYCCLNLLELMWGYLDLVKKIILYIKVCLVFIILFIVLGVNIVVEC